jgi:hypothetical protein
MIFCTLFNWRYVPQGVALYRSLDRATGGNFTLHILCIDDFALGALRALKLPNARLIPMAEIEDDVLRALRDQRSVGEFCWTCTTPLLLHVLRKQPPDAVVTYVDADLWFDADPRAVLEEMGQGSIYVHEHDFAPDHQSLEASTGRFNVGLISFRNNIEGLACLERWKSQCIEECVMDPAAGKCGDQYYLDEWPERYPGLVISKNPGVGLAPWNVGKRRIATKGGHFFVDERPMIFYHFHSLSMLRPRFGVWPMVMASGYTIDSTIADVLYAPYARELRRAARKIKSRRMGIEHALPTLPNVYGGARNQDIILQCGVYSSKTRHNPGVLEMLYGIDAKREIL